MDESESVPGPSSDDAPAAPPRKLTLLLEDDGLEVADRTTTLTPPERVKMEIDSYKQEAQCGMDANPLEWWKQHGMWGKFPTLSVLARTYLCIQGSSVASEGVFSTAGDIVSPTRARLDHVQVNSLIF